MLYGGQTALAGCPCNCDEILYGKGSGGSGNIYTYNIVGGCYLMDFRITGCGNRTVKGFRLSYVKDSHDPCLNQNWTIKQDGVTVGIYNPAFVNPTIGILDPVVGPCEERDYSYQICPVNSSACYGKTYNIDIEFIFEQGDLPCNKLSKTFLFEYTGPGEVNDEFEKNFTIQTTNEQIIINSINAVQEDKIEFELYDLFGSVIKNININKSENIINTEDLYSGKYYCSVKKNGNILGTFIYTVIK